MKGVKVLEALKEHKEMAFMVLGTVLEVGTVVLAIRNGIKAKQKLDELPEESTTSEKALAIAPYAIPVALTLGGSLGSFWYARHINIDKIISLGSAAAMMKMKADTQDTVVREIVTDEQYSEIEDKTAQERIKNGGFRSDRPAYDSGLPGATIFVEKQTGMPISATKEWIESRFLEWQNNVMFRAAKGLIKTKDVLASELYNGYFFLPSEDWMRATGWSIDDIPNLKIRFKYPDEKVESSVFNVPYTLFYVNKEPDELIPFH